VLAWRERPIEESRLLNPGFLAITIWSAAGGFQEVSQGGLPFQLAFIVIPVSLHKPTREALPRSLKTSFAAWIEENSTFRIGFAERANALSPFIREAILFGAMERLFEFNNAGCIVAEPRPRLFAKYLRETSNEVRDCVKRAEFAAKWFGLAGSPATVMALWGVKL
jgi:hypothetical protein